MRVLHRRLGGSIDRSNNVVLLTNKENNIQGMGLEAMSLQEINGSLEVRVGGKPEEIGTLSPYTRPGMLACKYNSGPFGIILLSFSSPRWDIIPSGHQRNPLLGLILQYMYWGQKYFSEKLKHTNTCRRKWCMY